MSTLIQPETQVIVFVIISLIIGFICQEINKKTHIPYTPLLILAGILLRGSDLFWDCFQEIQQINPHSILVIFIPLLIFESSINSHLEVLNKNKFQVFLLVVPGVIITLFFIGFSLKGILRYDDNDMTWAQAITLGTILATTDPVAIVAILKELGAPLHISTLIEMESLFNDGTAILFFGIFSAIATGKEFSLTSTIDDIFSLFLGGTGIGLAFGFACNVILKVFKQEIIGFICLSIIAAYSLFFVCDSFDLKISGFIGLVVLGFSLNNTMKDQMMVASKQSLSNIQYFIETILFFLSGIFMGSQFLEAETSVEPIDWLKMILFYFLVILARIIMVGLLYFPLKKTGEGFDLKKAIITSWGGLRGSVSIALALIIHLDNQFPLRIRNLIIFHCVGVSFLTLIINGTTCGWLIKILKIKDIKDERTQFRGQVLNDLHFQTKEILDELKYDQSYKLVDWKGAETLINIEQLELEIKNMDLNLKDSFIKCMEQEESSASKIAYENKMIQIARYHLLKILSNSVKDIQNKSWISNNIYDRIFDSIEISSEECFKEIDIWSYLRSQTNSLQFLTLLSMFEKTPFIGKLITIYIHFKLEFTYEMAYIVQQAIEETISKQKETTQLLQQLKALPHIKIKLIEELEQNLIQAKQLIEDSSCKFWNVVGKLQQRKAAQTVFMKQVKIVDDYMDQTYLSEKEGVEMKLQLIRKIENLSSFYSFFKLNTREDSHFRSAFKNYFTDEEFQDLMEKSENCIFQPYQFISKKGGIDEFIYIIIEGKQRKLYTLLKAAKIQVILNLINLLQKHRNF